MSVVIQPAGNPASREHYLDTVETLVNISQYQELIGNTFSDLQRVSENGKTALWGVTPGTNDANVSKYKKLVPGDLVIFTREKKVFASAQITHLFRNKKLAEELWGRDDKNQTWEYMYSLNNVEELDLTYRDLQKAIGSKVGDNFMGFRVLSAEKSAAALSLIKRDHALLRQSVEDAHERFIIQRVNIGPLEKENLVKARRGQGIFKSNVKLYESSCRVTGLSDTKHLIASHIKPWAESNDVEKIDGNNGLLLSPHIDQLFDGGYISFSDSGEILISPRLNPAVMRAWALSDLQNVHAFNPSQRLFLKYHRQYIFQN